MWPFKRTDADRRTPTGPAFDFKLFVTTDARQNALDDFVLAPMRLSGNTGLRPAMMLAGAQPPYDWSQNILVSGLGGTQSPVGTPAPLLGDDWQGDSFNVGY